MYFCIRNDIVSYGKDKIIDGGEGFAQGKQSHARGLGDEVGGWIVLRAQSGAGQAFIEDGQSEPTPRPV